MTTQIFLLIEIINIVGINLPANTNSNQISLAIYYRDSKSESQSIQFNLSKNINEQNNLTQTQVNHLFSVPHVNLSLYQSTSNFDLITDIQPNSILPSINNPSRAPPEDLNFI